MPVCSAGGIDFVLDSNEDYIVTELEKQKRKLREIGSALDSQHQLLRLIVQVSNHAFNTMETRYTLF